jgi:hypothetical protein
MIGLKGLVPSKQVFLLVRELQIGRVGKMK